MIYECRERGGAESVLSEDKGFDGRRGTRYDIDLAWDFGSGPTKVYAYFLILCSVHCVGIFSAGLVDLI